MAETILHEPPNVTQHTSMLIFNLLMDEDEAQEVAAILGDDKDEALGKAGYTVIRRRDMAKKIEAVLQDVVLAVRQMDARGGAGGAA